MSGPDYEFSSAFNERCNLVTRKIARLLSENSRASVSDISKTTGISRKTAKDRVLRMEKELGLRYSIELNESALKLTSPHLVAVHFDSKPDYGHIAGLLKRSYIPQVAVSVKGKYDLLIYAIATSNKEYVHWDKSMQILLAEYGADWKTSEVVHRQLGFFPLRNEIIERLDLDATYKSMLEILNTNARTSFQEMSRQLKMHFNTVAYNFNKLLKSGYIERFTIMMDKPKDVTLMSFLAKYKPKEGYEERSATARKAFTKDDQYSLVSRYVICAPLIGSYDFFTLGAFDNFNAAYKNDITYHRKLFKKDGIKMVYGEVDKVLIGRLPIRSLDTKKEYKTVAWTVDFEKE